MVARLHARTAEGCVQARTGRQFDRPIVTCDLVLTHGDDAVWKSGAWDRRGDRRRTGGLQDDVEFVWTGLTGKTHIIYKSLSSRGQLSETLTLIDGIEHLKHVTLAEPRLGLICKRLGELM